MKPRTAVAQQQVTWIWGNGAHVKALSAISTAGTHGSTLSTILLWNPSRMNFNL